MITKDLQEIKDIVKGVVGEELKDVKEDLKEVKEVQLAHTESLMRIEQNQNIYDDMYKVNKDGIAKHEKRISRIEGHFGIKTPSELVVS